MVESNSSTDKQDVKVKIIFVMIDGVGDISDLTLNSKRTLLNHSLEKTPLQAA